MNKHATWLVRPLLSCFRDIFFMYVFLIVLKMFPCIHLQWSLVTTLWEDYCTFWVECNTLTHSTFHSTGGMWAAAASQQQPGGDDACVPSAMGQGAEGQGEGRAGLCQTTLHCCAVGSVCYRIQPSFCSDKENQILCIYSFILIINKAKPDPHLTQSPTIGQILWHMGVFTHGTFFFL